MIRCNCGRRIVRKEVVQTGLYVNRVGPSYVYIRFRCGRCRRLGEQLVEETQWDPTVLQQPEPPSGEINLAHFSTLGTITPEEVIDFHYALDRLDAERDGADDPT